MRINLKLIHELSLILIYDNRRTFLFQIIRIIQFIDTDVVTILVIKQRIMLLVMASRHHLVVSRQQCLQPKTVQSWSHRLAVLQHCHALFVNLIPVWLVIYVSYLNIIINLIEGINTKCIAKLL